MTWEGTMRWTIRNEPRLARALKDIDRIRVLRRAWNHHAKHARRRGIKFLLSFNEWLTIWEESGKIENKGTRSGQYVMGRNFDRGDYVVGNVSIIPTEQNSIDGLKMRDPILLRERIRQHRLDNPMTETHKLNISRALTGRALSENHRKNMSIAQRRRYGNKISNHSRPPSE